MSETEIDLAQQQHQQTGGAKPRKAKTMKQRQAAKGRRDARQMIKLADTLPHEVRKSGFHYDEESSREVLEESRELGNQTDDESEPSENMSPNPVIKKQSIAYRVVANKRPGGKPKVQIRGLELDYDNTKSPFVNATYLEQNNNSKRIVEGILNAAARQSDQTFAATAHSASKPRKQLRKRKQTAKKHKQK